MICRLAPAVLIATALLAIGCSPQDGDRAAGVPVGQSSSSAAQGAGVADPAVVAAAGLEPCPSGDSVDGSAPAPVTGGLPDLSLPCVGAGPPVRLSALRGTPWVVNVWAGWCLPCRDELPILAAVARDAVAAGSPVRFLGIDALETSPDDAVRLLADSGATYPSVRDDAGATRAALRWAGPPMTVLVRADGTVAYRFASALTSAEQLRGLLREHLGVELS